MTGPRNALTHPQYRRGRRLLPLAAAILLGQLGCSTDQPTEPTSPTTTLAATARHPLPKSAGRRAGSTIRPNQAIAPRVSLSLGTAFSGTGPSVLVLADSDFVSTNALANSLANAGFVVSLRPAPENTWDGTNPSLSGFDAVVHLNGATYDAPLPSSAQTALTSFVQNGGGFVTARWNGYESQPEMPELMLQDMDLNPDGSEQNCGACQITYEALAAAAGHPVLAGIPASFTFMADGHDAGPQVVFASNPSTVLMRVPSGRPAVLARELGQGRVVSFSFAPNYYFDGLGEIRDPTTLQDPTVQQLYINAVGWVAGSESGTAEPQSITFGPLPNRVFGDADFSVSASASSGLPVSLSSAGTCTVLGTTVSITGAGTCTLTASQAGNDDYAPAEDVVQSFTIAQATPLLSWTPGSITAGVPLGAQQLNATATGVGGVTLAGSFAYTPAAGTILGTGPTTLSVVFTPASPNYHAVGTSVSMTVQSGITFKGFFSPIRNLPAVNVVTAGTSVPVKFTVGGKRWIQILASNSPSSEPAVCPTGTPEHTVRPGVSGSSGLRSMGYSYAYVWKTNPGWAGTCRRFILTLADGSRHEAMFRFKAASRVSTAARILGH
ncbi:MAG TPA: PxKF domain-containing protein [Gemmatimonadales bacterium]